MWVFSGQGSQWPRMGAGLLATEPVFAATVAAMEPVIARESGFSVTEAMSAPQTVTGIDRVQPTVFAMQVALAATMKSYGVRPGAVIGHSLGEAAAAVVAGALSLEDGLRVICRRSRLMARIAGSGAMASVELPAQQVLSELSIRGVTDVVLSVVASPTSTVVGGATQTIRDLVAAWEQREVMAREVAVDVASHSPQVDPILDELTEVLADLEPMTPEVPYYSATLWDPRDQPAFDGDYWADNLRYTVRFAAAVQAALEDGYRVFGELAPHPLLTHAVEQNASSLDMPIAALAAMRREQELPFGLRGFVADVHSAGAAVDFSALYPGGRLVDAPLPTWTHRELMLSRERRTTKRTAPRHWPFIHCSARTCTCWRNRSATCGRARSAPWRTRGLPTTRFTAWPRFPVPPTARWHWPRRARRLGDASEVRDIRFEQTLLLDDETLVSAGASVVSARRSRLRGGDPPRTANASAGRARFCTPREDDGTSHRRTTWPPCWRTIRTALDGAELRKAFDSVGIQYGPAFSGLAAVHIADGDVTTVLAEVGAAGSDPLAAGRLREPPRPARCVLPVRCRAPRSPERRQRRSAVACRRAPTALLSADPQRALLPDAGDRVTTSASARPTSTSWTSPEPCS